MKLSSQCVNSIIMKTTNERAAAGKKNYIFCNKNQVAVASMVTIVRLCY